MARFESQCRCLGSVQFVSTRQYKRVFVLLAEEAAGRDRSTREMHRRAARLPSGKTFDPLGSERVGDPGRRLMALRSLDGIGRAENLGLVGPSGTGKSRFAEAIAHAAIDRDLRVSGFSLESLTATIARSRTDASTGKVVDVDRPLRADGGR